MGKALAAETLKVRKRWMPYVLLLVMVAGAAVVIWLAGYVNYTESRILDLRRTPSARSLSRIPSRRCWITANSGARRCLSLS